MQKKINRNDIISFWNALRCLNPDKTSFVVTAVNEEHLGERMIISDGECIWRSRESGIFDTEPEAIRGIRDGGLRQFDGMPVFCDAVGKSKKIVICGGGHVSIPIIRMGKMIGCTVTVLEDRPRFADSARRAGAHRVICNSFERGLMEVEGDADTYFVIVTRGHRYDQICLEQIIGKKHAYIGMMGSRRRAAIVKEAILAKGADPAVVSHVHTPIGLDIGAETPEEIAVAVIGEIIQEKNRGKGSGGYPEEILQCINEKLDTERSVGVLATIVARRGSAPRAAGTKMLILPDGTTVGTIGGGCAEAEVQRRAMQMLFPGERNPSLCHVSMSGDDAEEEGMSCGGEIDVLLEVI